MNKLHCVLFSRICCWNYQAYRSRAREEEHSLLFHSTNYRDEENEERRRKTTQVRSKWRQTESTALLARGGKWPFKETDRRQAGYSQSKARSCRQAETHLRPAGSNKLPTHSKWVCVSIEEGKQKAEGIRSERRENGQVSCDTTPAIYKVHIQAAPNCTCISTVTESELTEGSVTRTVEL